MKSIIICVCILPEPSAFTIPPFVARMTSLQSVMVESHALADMGIVMTTQLGKDAPITAQRGKPLILRKPP